MSLTLSSDSSDSERRCANCGCGIDVFALTCTACGVQVASTASSAAAVGERPFTQKPMPAATYDIPLGATDSIGATFKLWSENLLRLGALGFLPYALVIPAAAGAGAFAAFARVDDYWPLLVAGGTAFGALCMVLWLASTAACIHLVDEKTQGGDLTLGAALLASFKHIGWLFAGCLIVAAVWMVGMAAPIIPLAWGIGDDEPTIALLALPALAITAAMLFVAARLLPLFPVIVLEDADVFTAASRAWRLTAPHTWPVIGAMMLFGLVYMGASMAAGMIGIVPVIGAIVQMGVNAFLVPLCWVFSFVIYAGCVRNESRR